MNKRIKTAAWSLLALGAVACSSNSTNGDWPVPEEPICEMNYTPAKTTFTLWAPTAEEVEVTLYTAGETEEVLPMQAAESCLWVAEKEGDQQGKEYTFRTHSDGSSVVKSPMDMFSTDKIPNDLKLVDTTIREYYGMKG